MKFLLLLFLSLLMTGLMDFWSIRRLRISPMPRAFMAALTTAIETGFLLYLFGVWQSQQWQWMTMPTWGSFQRSPLAEPDPLKTLIGWITWGLAITATAAFKWATLKCLFHAEIGWKGFFRFVLSTLAFVFVLWFCSILLWSPY